jgi:hypothetical protein
MPPIVVAAIALGTAGAAASVISSSQQASSAKKAAEAQQAVGMAQIEASLKAPQLATDAANAKLKAKQASSTQTILTAPGGLKSTEGNTNQPTILGVG